MYEKQELELTGLDLVEKIKTIIYANDPNKAAEIGKNTNPLPQRDIARIGYILLELESEISSMLKLIKKLSKEVEK